MQEDSLIHPLEEKYLHKTSRAHKEERKRKRATDRSKFKKTDQDQFLKQNKTYVPEDKELIEGRVICVSPLLVAENSYLEPIPSSLRGVLKKEKNHLKKNLIAVGDLVFLKKEGDHTGTIFNIQPRKTVLSRADNFSRKKEHVIVANVDLLIITTSVGIPPLKPNLIDRYLIAAQNGNLEAIIVINKIDLLEDAAYEEEREFYLAVLEAYKIAGIKVISVSSFNQASLQPLKDLMRDKVSVFSGQSGTGKSSLINALTRANRQVGNVIERTKKGSHTTTNTELLPLNEGGWCIDTPGIKSFGIWDLKKQMLQNYFPEIQKYSVECKFLNCKHFNEEDCAVQRAVEKKLISPIRFASYKVLSENLQEEYLKR